MGRKRDAYLLANLSDLVPVADNNNYLEDLYKFNVVPRAGVEPATFSLGRNCSIQLSYRGACIILADFAGK